MTSLQRRGKILVVDDEWESGIVQAVRRRLEEEGWASVPVEGLARNSDGEEMEEATLYAIEEQAPEGILLDIRLGEYREDQFRGLTILQKIVEHYPKLPVLMFTQYVQGPEREMAARGSLKWDAPVDFIDKLASPEEVVLRLRRLIGAAPDRITINSLISLDTRAGVVYTGVAGEESIVPDIHGMKFEILRELATAWYRSPGELVPFSRLERYSDGEEARASLRVRIREIKSSLGNALGIRFGAGDLIVNVRDQGYRLVPPKGR